MNRFEEAKKIYREAGVDVEKALERLSLIPVSMHCWQGDDVKGFLSDGELSGGIQTTGNYPYRARNFEELTADMDFAFSLIPGKKRINLHAIYAILTEKKDVDELTVEDFRPWIEWAKKRNVGIDFNPTLFSHPMVKNGLTLSSPDENVRKFWIKHVKACRKIAAEIGKEQGSPCLNNLWIPDGLKDVPGNRLTPRMRLKASLDEVYAVKYPKEYIVDSVESKVFGIGVESYTVGSSEFYMNYAALNGLCCLLDNGHYHPTEVVSDKIPSMLAFFDKVALHVTRGVRWDSDHVVVFEDELKEIAKEIIRNNADQRVLIGLDYFDASINRVMAWVTGMRNMQKALLWALLLPNEETTKLQDEARFTELMYLNEKMKTYPFGDVWEEYLKRNGVKSEFLTDIKDYEKELNNRK
ncbi:MAG: L-rhamnose isomerase [Candidatus Borkfalkiaceae bacterium]|nr:L-rhamnose isomerase [Christensenellaceae bacterium]